MFCFVFLLVHKKNESQKSGRLNSALSFNQAKSYLQKRNITEEDIIRYNIGYCTDGVYGGRVIIPSYDANGILNYFIARSFYNSKLKYKNPPVPKDTVIFELYINWNMPIVLCEGVFDATAIKRNAIPLLGKTVQDSLLSKLVSNKASEVIIALDSDASEMVSKVSQKLKKWIQNDFKLGGQDLMIAPRGASKNALPKRLPGEIIVW